MGIIHRLSISIGDLFLIDSRDVNLSRVFEAINEIIGKPFRSCLTIVKRICVIRDDIFHAF